MATAHRKMEKSSPRAAHASSQPGGLGPGLVKPNLSLPKIEEPLKLQRQLRVALLDDDAPIISIALTEAFGAYVSRSVKLLNQDAVFTVDEAVSTFQALRPDVVITDLSLTPGNTEGFEILRRIKELSPSAVVVLLSSTYNPRGTDEVNQDITEAGFDALFEKARVRDLCAFIGQLEVRP
jgi:DNA-binding NtrC family response regulator